MKTSYKFIALCIVAAAACIRPAAAQMTTEAATPAPGTLWSLDDCMNYAIQNNITVQQRSLQVEQSEVNLSTAKLSRLPDLNASVGARANFATKTTMTDKDNNNVSYGGNTRTGSFGVSSTMPIFQGMRINRQIKGGKLDLAAAVQDLERIREDVSINVMTLYLEVLYSKELVWVAQNQLTLSTQQAVRSREQVNAGKQPESARYESEALQAKDELSLTEAKNNLQIALLNLSQALNRESAAGFDIVEPVFDSLTLATLHLHGSVGNVYAYAADHRPHIKAERLRLESSENAIKTARSDFYPSLSLSGGYDTGVKNGTADEQGKLISFGNQLRNNSSEYIGLSLSIPIFNRNATRSKVNLAKIAARNQQLAVTEAEQALRKEIEQAWYKADAAYSKYTSANAALSSAKIAFEYEQQKAEAGRSTIFDFNDAKTRMEKAESDLVQAKYEFVFSSKILDFYRGNPLKL
ncbi:TolC family protein [uncultured Alistipes sp.]|jgi:hypothetical protein|uniref:TolC family protein n=1 Tax=uncultured Alistipes sp. TaxID=538949 RepID=UPI0025F035F4|nr:TolC family protein [uncultured Alistipes sp.]